MVDEKWDEPPMSCLAAAWEKLEWCFSPVGVTTKGRFEANSMTTVTTVNSMTSTTSMTTSMPPTPGRGRAHENFHVFHFLFWNVWTLLQIVTRLTWSLIFYIVKTFNKSKTCSWKTNLNMYTLTVVTLELPPSDQHPFPFAMDQWCHR